jgi:hypothetical protein
MRLLVLVVILFAGTAEAQVTYWFQGWQRQPDAKTAQEYFMLPGTSVTFTYTNNRVVINASGGSTNAITNYVAGANVTFAYLGGNVYQISASGGPSGVLSNFFTTNLFTFPLALTNGFVDTNFVGQFYYPLANPAGYVTASITNGLIGQAPSDGTYYGQFNGAWTRIPAQTNIAFTNLIGVVPGTNVTFTTNAGVVSINSSGGGGTGGLVTNEFTTTPGLMTNTFARLQTPNGTVAPTNLATGSADITRFLRGDGTWQLPPGATSTTTNTPMAIIYSTDGYGSNFILDFNYSRQILAFTNYLVWLASTNGPDATHAGDIYAYIPPTNYVRRVYFTTSATNWNTSGLSTPYTTLPGGSPATIEAHAYGLGETNVTVWLMIFSPQPYFFAWPTFNPLSIGGCQLWLQANSGVFQSEFGTNAATTAGQAVKYWMDLSGSGNHCTNASSPFTYQPNGGPNGYAAVLAPASFTANTELRSKHFTSTTPPMYIFIVEKINAPGSQVYSMGGPSDAGQFCVLQSGALGMNTLTTSGYNGGKGIDATFFTATHFVNAGGSTFYIRTNGVNCGTPGSGATTTVNEWALCSNNGTASSNPQYVTEMLVYLANLSTNDLQNVENYLKSRYALY